MTNGPMGAMTIGTIEIGTIEIGGIGAIDGGIQGTFTQGAFN